MVTNAVPIAAGFVLFGESLPHGARAVLQVAAFACLVAGAVALGHQQPPPAAKPAPQPFALFHFGRLATTFSLFWPEKVVAARPKSFAGRRGTLVVVARWA